MENLAQGDEFVTELLGKIDEQIDAHHIQADEASDELTLKDGYAAEIIEELDLHAEGITSIVWATGYKFDFNWIKLPILDQDGYPIQDRGVSEYPGLYFLGLNWLYKRRSGILLGVGDDAAHVAEHLADRKQPPAIS